MPFWKEKPPDYPVFSLNRALADFIREEIRETFLDWRHDLEKRPSDAVRSMAIMYMERANAVANRILEIAGELFNLSLPRLETEIVLSDEGEFWFRIGDPLTDQEIIFGAISRLLPKGLSRRLVRRRQREELLTLFDRHCGRIRYDFLLRLQKSVDALSCQVDEVIKGTLEAIESGIEKALREMEEGEVQLRAAQKELRQRQEVLAGARKRVKGILQGLADVPAVP